MIVKNSAREKNTATFDVELDPTEFEKHVNGAFLKNRGRIMVPGFRKGKAPRMVIEGMYGKDVFYEDAINDAAAEAFTFGVEQEKLKTVGRPAMQNADVTGEKGIVLSFRTDVWPEVTLGQYKGLEAEREEVSVTDDEVGAEVEKMRKQNGRLVTAERPAQDGDTVNIDYRGTLNGEPFEGGTAEGYSLVLGSNSFVPGFESQLVGISAGEEKDIDVTFPENYHAGLAGKAVVFHVKCNEVKFEELPALDDEFAKDNDFDSLEKLTADVRERLEKARRETAENAFRDSLVDQAVANMTADVPASMVEERLDGMMQEYARYMGGQGIKMEDYLKMMGTDLASFREKSRATAEKQTKTEVLLAAVAEAENLAVTDEDIDAEIGKIAESYGMKPEDVKKAVDTAGLSEELLRRKAVSFLADNGVAVAKAARPADAAPEGEPEKAE